ncbi:MAG: transcription-repair coupling factor [Phycisphaerales bacterium]|nr:transcription-repair coupling factor [Phycisphaerales bacterium]
MNLETLLEEYNQSNIINRIDHGIQKYPAVYLENLKGGSLAFYIASMAHKQTDAHQLIIADNATMAAYLTNTLENLLQHKRICYFPSSFTTEKKIEKINSSMTMLRSEALLSVNDHQSGTILVSYPEAILEKVTNSRSISEHTIKLHLKQTIHVQELIEQLKDLNFAKSDFTYEPGQFAMRGGIIDVYSYGYEKPYRIELSDNLIESIRVFDPQSQISEKTVGKITITSHLDKQAKKEDKISIVEFMPPNTCLWLTSWNIIQDQLQHHYKLLHQFIETAATVEASNDLPPLFLTTEDIIDPQLLLQQVTHKKIIEFGNKAHFAQETITCDTSPQPTINRQFSLLIQELKNYQEQEYKVFIFAEQPKQLERLYNIFEDMNQQIHFIGIPYSIHQGFIDKTCKILVFTDHQIFERYHKYKIKTTFNKNKALTLELLRAIQPGDFITHIDHGVGVYKGLKKMEVNGHLQEVVQLLYRDNDILLVHINSLHKITKYSGKEGTVPTIHKIGTDAWNKLKEKTKKKVKEIAFDLIELYAKRKASKGFAHSPDNFMQLELEASFMYEDTPDQSKATADVKKDMEQTAPMDRLICGDVGFGKTEIAIRAVFKTCLEKKQAAVLVPTTILAFQHYQTFKERLKDYPITIDYLNRFKSSKEKKETIEKVKQGLTNIIIGTHALLSKDIQFKDLGLLVIDEEQKFGVAHKEKIKLFKNNVDCLTLTATPIPRTLQFSLMGARDLSIIQTPPPNRQPVHTELQVFNPDFIREAIYFETNRGGQVFFIYNRIEGVKEINILLEKLCPDLSISYAHGQMPGHELEEKILDFIERKYDVLISTNIVENGVDISNVNTIIINEAHHFGLSDLHQLRGRVGRNNKKAFCYLLTPPIHALPTDSFKRLQILEEFSDLGSGFQIAMRDLDIRGAGNLLGGEQTGFITEIGFDMYQRILQEAIIELKKTNFKDTFKEELIKLDSISKDCGIETDFEILIPDSYIANTTERLSIYTKISNYKNEEDLDIIKKELIDRFGPIPAETESIFIAVQCRHIGAQLGFENIIIRQNIMRCYFINQPDSLYFESKTFQSITKFVQENPIHIQLKEANKNLIMVVKNIKCIEEGLDFLKRIFDCCNKNS